MNGDKRYCKNDDVIRAQGLECKPEDWQLFTDALKLSIMTALYSGNDLPSSLSAKLQHFVKAMTQNRKCFRYLLQKFPWIGNKRIKESTFCLSWQMKGISWDPRKNFSQNWKRSKSTVKFKLVVDNFLGNHKTLNYRWLKEQMFKAYSDGMQKHFLLSYLDLFSRSPGEVSDE